MSNDVAMCTYHGITMHDDIAINLFYYVLSALCLIMILLWVVWNKNKNNIPTHSQLMFSPQTDQTLTCSYSNSQTCAIKLTAHILQV